MLLILLSILLSSLLVISFKVFVKLNIDTSNAIAINYISACACGVVLGFDTFQQINLLEQTWFPYTLLFGIMFISIFNLVGYGVKKSGLMVVSVAQKMSLIIPLAFSIWWYNESYGWMKIFGIVLALLSIYFCSKKTSETSDTSKNNFIIPFLIFAGSGLVDVSIKVSQEYFGREVPFSVILACIFGAAGVVGLSSRLIARKHIKLKDVAGGLTLGFINFSSTYFLMKALSQDQFESSFIFAINNIGIILFSTMVANIIFKEKLERINYIGILIALSSILFIYFSNAF